MEDDFCWETDFQVLLAGKKEKIFFLEMFLKALDSWRFDEISFKIILLITYHILGRWRPLPVPRSPTVSEWGVTEWG